MNSTDDKKTAFCVELLKAVREFRPVYDDQMAYFEELLITLMLAELARFLLGRSTAEVGGKIPPDQLKDVSGRTAEFLERRLELGDKEEVEWILSGFVEGLLGEDDHALSLIRPVFGPKIEKALAAHLD